MAIEGGRNIAMKVPPHQWSATVGFYRDLLGLEVVEQGEQTVAFQFGANRLWIDRVASMSQAELWLELVTDDLGEAERLLATPGVVRCDEIEPLPEGFRGFWIANPAAIIHLVNERRS